MLTTFYCCLACHIRKRLNFERKTQLQFSASHAAQTDSIKHRFTATEGMLRGEAYHSEVTLHLKIEIMVEDHCSDLSSRWED